MHIFKDDSRLSDLHFFQGKFSDCGDIITVKIPLDSDKGLPKGIAFVQFAEPVSLPQVDFLTNFKHPLNGSKRTDVCV
jgi:hypothetical protein